MLNFGAADECANPPQFDFQAKEAERVVGDTVDPVKFRMLHLPMTYAGAASDRLRFRRLALASAGSIGRRCVHSSMKRLHGPDDVHVIIFKPSSAPVTSKSRDVPRMTVGRASTRFSMHRYLSALLDPFATLLEVHQLMYFMQEAGEPLNLGYNKGRSCPSAVQLRPRVESISKVISFRATPMEVTYQTRCLELVPDTLKTRSDTVQDAPDR